ncbi:Transcriptional regulator [Frankia canadensis]|uniref:Transcriptional regulator n=1 Tax=Frankia canadensis TaxID=1836972 RepID=A0A2I2KMG4_9ACTN|nr:TetR/AcrR family transcriptional regulator C-terminal domain-containing protein [Frankia canadensis]SNQ46867.1 Transcriptional regulator [Frankia canadensis]SOU54157.1 Transcriptional regulator [Frankia canadensis]
MGDQTGGSGGPALEPAADPALDMDVVASAVDLVWTKPTARRRPALTREAIVEAAIAIADAEGIEAVSIRRVAAALDARPMTLYSHIARKDGLLALMADHIAAEVLVPEPLPARWRDALRAIAHRTRDSSLRHPWMLRIHAGHPLLGPNALRHAEQSAAAVAELPLPPRRRVALLRAIDTYTLGHVATELHERQARDAYEPGVLQSYLADVLGSGDHPHLAQLPMSIVVASETDARERFEEGLEWLLDGIAASVDAALEDPAGADAAGADASARKGQQPDGVRVRRCQAPE